MEGDMAGETDLRRLLCGMDPRLEPVPYGYVTLAPGRSVPPGLVPFASVAEDEGLTLVAPAAALADAGLPPGPPWARISLAVQSDLAAVGLTAAFAAALADVGISANVIAGFHHDHLFVPWPRREAAVAALVALAGSAADG